MNAPAETLPRFGPDPGDVPAGLEAYAVPVGEAHPRHCVRCLTVSNHWRIHVYRGWREVRLCGACFAAWEARK